MAEAGTYAAGKGDLILLCQQSAIKVYLPRKSVEQYPSDSEYAPRKRTVEGYGTSMEEHRKLSVWLRRNVKA